MLAVTQKNSDIIKDFESIQPGMRLNCFYKLGSKKDSPQGDGKIAFTGQVIQKTKRLIAVRDRKSEIVYCLSINDCICGSGKYRIISK